MVSGFSAEDLRYFRLPFAPLNPVVAGEERIVLSTACAWLIAEVPILQRFATSVAVRLRKQS